MVYCSSGDVESVGDGRVGSLTHAFTTKPGDTVLYSKFGLGATEVQVSGVDYILIREADLIGIMPRSAATAEDVPELRPIGDRVLLQVRGLDPRPWTVCLTATADWPLCHVDNAIAVTCFLLIPPRLDDAILFF